MTERFQEAKAKTILIDVQVFGRKVIGVVEEQARFTCLITVASTKTF